MSVATEIFERESEKINSMDCVRKIKDYHGLNTAVVHTDSPMVEIRVKFGHGAHHDSIPGTHHALEHMLFSGRNEQIVSALEMLGANINAYTDRTSIVFIASCVHDVAGDVLELLVNMLTPEGFSIDPAQWEKEKTTIQSERVGYETSQDEIYWTELTSLLINDKRTVVGHKEDIDSITPEVLMKEYNDMYFRQNVTVAIMCNTSIYKYAIKKFLDALVESIPLRPDFHTDDIAPPSHIIIDTEHLVHNEHVNSNELGVTYAFDVAPDNIYFDTILMMLVVHLGNGVSSPVMKRLREKYGHVYEANAFMDRTSWGSSLMFNVNVDGKPVDEYRNEIDAIVYELTTFGLSVSDYTKMINRTKFILGTRMSHASDAISAVMYGLNVGSDVIYPTSVQMEILRNMTPGDFNAVVNSLFTDHVQAKVVFSLLPENK